MREFRVGDKVRIIPECNQKLCGHNEQEAGHKGSINSIGKYMEDDEDGITYAHPDNFDVATISEIDVCIALSCLELIDDEPLPLP